MVEVGVRRAPTVLWMRYGHRLRNKAQRKGASSSCTSSVPGSISFHAAHKVAGRVISGRLCDKWPCDSRGHSRVENCLFPHAKSRRACSRACSAAVPLRRTDEPRYAPVRIPEELPCLSAHLTRRLVRRLWRTQRWQRSWICGPRSSSAILLLAPRCLKLTNLYHPIKTST